MRQVLTGFLVATLLAITTVVAADDRRQKDAIRVSLLRATPGHLEDLINEIKAQNVDQLVLRHSQGDHWDIMIVGRYGDTWQRRVSGNELANYSKSLRTPVDFDMTFKATCGRSKLAAFLPRNRRSGSQKQFAIETDRTNLFHIEMFHAAGGKQKALMEQRRMENNYLKSTGRRGNTICQVESGSDVDVFTIGFYRDLAHFAEEPDLPEEAFERAARAAGFKNRADISFYLRELIVGHQDTLATKIE